MAGMLADLKKVSAKPLPYAAPGPVRRASPLGVASVLIAVAWWSATLLFGPWISTRQVVLALIVEIGGFALGWAAIFNTRARTFWGWLGVALNTLPVLLVFCLWLWIVWRLHQAHP